jgi:hypothetical protein
MAAIAGWLALAVLLGILDLRFLPDPRRHPWNSPFGFTLAVIAGRGTRATRSELEAQLRRQI